METRSVGTVVEPLGHGYTTADLDALVGKAVWWSPWQRLPFDERWDVAQFAIVEHLMTVDDPPRFWALVFIGRTAIDRYAVEEGRQRGWHLAGTRAGTRIARYHRYWYASARLYDSCPENRVVDGLALRQIWPKLTEAQQEALLTIAKHGDVDKAAAELGTTHHALIWLQAKARKRFLLWWHEHETPSHIWGHNMPRDPSKKPAYRGVATRIFRGRERRLAAKTTGHDAPSSRPAISS